MPDSGGVFRKVDLKVPGGTARSAASKGVADLLPQVTSPDTSTLANPASLTISNITSENNQSFVECFREGFGLSNATIIVEGEGTINIQNLIIAMTAIYVDMYMLQINVAIYVVQSYIIYNDKDIVLILPHLTHNINPAIII